MPKTEFLLVRVEPEMKKEMEIFLPKASKEVRILIKEMLDLKKREAFGPLLHLLKGNRYATVGIDAAIEDVAYYSKCGYPENETRERIINVLKEKFDFPEEAGRCFYDHVYKGVYRDAETMLQHKQSIVEFFGKHAEKD